MVRRRTGAVVLLVVFLIVATVAYGVLTVGRPQVESVDNDWGTVTADRTEVETQLTVDNTLLLRVGGPAADISYTVSMNDIEVATGEKNRINLGGDEKTVAVSTWLDNDEIPEWWASHVNRNETTTVRVEPDVVVNYAGIRLPATEWARTQTVHTNLLEPLETNESQQLQVAGQTLLVVDETNAQWGTATATRTPIDASATVTNPTPVPVPITELRYTVRLNGIVVGQGIAGQQTVLRPNNTRTLEASAAINNSKLDEWWVTHLRNDERSTLTVDFTATLSYGGVQRTVPLEFLSYEQPFETDLLGQKNESESTNGSVSDEPGQEQGQQSSQRQLQRTRDAIAARSSDESRL
ncbi:LEA14-like dessication related protein [Natrinema hispanicum]|uniref:LEA14-like dessication related protein n=1 Tax=Natrinema hispanicum TaxID=392421 RepID=A0A482YFY4_9EURY|nr:LEA type 2 family protein [Natrinema hispanicum]RZV11731.1 LEA14-like dessication related protein [Natrinema hispanicum]